MTLGYPVIQHELDNGLRVVVSEDHASPSATAHLHYDVGSQHEVPGRTGLAHLFEHLMFSGSRNVGPGEHAALMHACGSPIVHIFWPFTFAAKAPVAVAETKHGIPPGAPNP